MSMKFKSIEFIASGDDGWVSGQLDFGSQVTIVHADNTTGKTPLLKGIVFCLGYPITMPELIKEKCSKIILKVNIDKAPYEFIRSLKEKFLIEIHSEFGKTEKFEDANHFSQRLFDLLKIERHLLTKKQGLGSNYPYVDTLFPLFWIDQDFGWNDIYRPIDFKDFIKSAKQEMIRLLLGVEPKYPHNDKTQHQLAKDRLKTTIEAIKLKKGIIKQLKFKFESNPLEIDEITKKKEKLESDLENISDKMGFYRDGNTIVRDSIREADSKKLSLYVKLEELNSKRNYHISQATDLEAEITILSYNTNISDAFKEYCGAESCKVFKKEFFGKKLLYLKDQKKDLLVVATIIKNEIDRINELVKTENDKINFLKTSLEIDKETESVQKLSKQIINEIVTLEVKIANLKSENEIISQFNELLNQQEEDKKNVEEFKSRGSPRKVSTSLEKVIEILNSSIGEWLTVIGFEFQKVYIDNNFDVFINEKEFKSASEESGSSRQRVLLAFYGALIEASIELNGKHPGFMIFDGIVQHELNIEDLKNYLIKLNSLSKQNPIQTIFSITDESFTLDIPKGKKTWVPTFPEKDLKTGKIKDMYLGKKL